MIEHDRGTQADCEDIILPYYLQINVSRVKGNKHLVEVKKITIKKMRTIVSVNFGVVLLFLIRFFIIHVHNFVICQVLIFMYFIEYR